MLFVGVEFGTPRHLPVSFREVSVPTKRKKERPLTVDAIKEALLPSIANLFETHAMQVDGKLKVLKGEIIHEVKVLLDNDKRIETAIDLSKAAADNANIIKDHSRRIAKLETEINK